MPSLARQGWKISQLANFIRTSSLVDSSLQIAGKIKYFAATNHHRGNHSLAIFTPKWLQSFHHIYFW